MLASMCGIFASVAPADASCASVIEPIRVLEHRGPSARGSTEVRLPWARVGLGMARLAIVDQSGLTVPYQYPAAGVVLAFNGEIYNWQELRRALDVPPSLWSSSCDAEVVAWAWRKWGPQCLSHFNGMWSFVLVDTTEGRIFIARDRAGKKPLYWAVREEVLYLSSEVKAFPFALEAAPCADVDTFEFDCRAETPFLGVQRLEGGHYLLLEKSEDVLAPVRRRWWELPAPGVRLPPRSYEEGVEELRALICDAVRLRAIAEVPVALQLSGGLDSAIITAAHEANGGTPLNTYCMDFRDEGIDNLTAARLVDPSVREVGLGPRELLELIPRVVFHLDSPATWSAVCLWKLAESIARDGHRVLLSGEGADELFGGYSRYRILYWLDRMREDPLLTAYGPTMRHLLLGGSDAMLARLIDRSPKGVARRHATALVRQYGGAAGLGLVRRCMRVEWHTTMQVLLRMGDRMASAWSLENRCPLLDYRIIELACSLPTDWLVREGASKAILRSVATSLGVPESIVGEKTKRGLAIPWARWSTALGVETAGSRGEWNRSGFAALQQAAWVEHCLRPAR